MVLCRRLGVNVLLLLLWSGKAEELQIMASALSGENEG
jgi:hypothetical protein